MKGLRLFGILLLSAAAPACARKTPQAEFTYDHTASFAGFRTYGWFEDPGWQMPSGNSVVDAAFIDRNVRRDVDESLRSKGLRTADQGRPDIFVAYRMDSAGVRSHSDFAADHTTEFLLWSWDHLEYAGTNYRTQGALVLDIRNGDRQLIWRGERTGTLGSNPEEIARHIRKSVDLLLSRFPPPSRPSDRTTPSSK